MSFTPAFQKVYDKLQEMLDAQVPLEIIQDFFKTECLTLGAYERINNLYRIRPKLPEPGSTSRYVFFKMNTMQDKYWTGKTNRDLILKMRQGGITTMSCIIALDKAIWENGSRSAIMADTTSHVKEYFLITKIGFRQFQKDWGTFYPVTEDVDNVHALKIKETEGHLLVCTNTRGLTVDFLHIAEAAFIDDLDIADSIEAVPFSGWIILETTADTASGMFYHLWHKAVTDSTNSFKPHFFEWWIRYPEERDIEALRKRITNDFKYTDEELALVKEHGLTKEHIIWRRLKISENEGDLGRFNRNYPSDSMTCFLAGSSSVFPAEVLQSLWINERAPSFTGDLVSQA